MWAFLKPNIRWAQLDNEYDDILARLKGGATLLDLGCGFAQDLRTLAADGAPTESMFATGESQTEHHPLSQDFSNSVAYKTTWHAD